MSHRDLDTEAADRLLGAEQDQRDLPEDLERLSALLDDVRLMRAEPDPAAERETIRAMAAAVGRRRGLRRPALRLASPVRVALALGALLVLTTAGAALAGASLPAGDVLESFGLEPADERDMENDRLDRQRDLEDLAADAAEREAESHEPLPDPARAGGEKAAARSEGARGFTRAMREWTGCVRTGASRYESSGSTGEFDPVRACGARPRPQAHGLGGDGEAEAPSDTDGPPSGAGPPAGRGP